MSHLSAMLPDMNPAEHARAAIVCWTAEPGFETNHAMLRDCIVASIKDAVDEETVVRDQRILDLERDAASSRRALERSHSQIRDKCVQLLRDAVEYQERELRRAEERRADRRASELDRDWQPHIADPWDTDVAQAEGAIQALGDAMSRLSKF